MAKLLLSSGDWGDEFDLEGFLLFYSDEDAEAYFEGIPDKAVDCYYGSNEFVCFENKADYLSHITVKDLTETEADSFLDILGLKPKGYKGSVKYGLFIPNSQNY